MIAAILTQSSGAILPLTVDLATLEPAQVPCGVLVGNQIVVCARRETDQRIEYLPDAPPVRAEFMAGDTKAAVVAEQRGGGG